MVDSANIAQVSCSCIQLLSVLSAEPLHSACVLILFNKMWDSKHTHLSQCSLTTRAVCRRRHDLTSFCSVVFQRHALHYESYRDQVTVQNGWHHCICWSANHNIGNQCPLRTGTSGSAQLAGVHPSQVIFHSYAPEKIWCFNKWLSLFYTRCQDFQWPFCWYIFTRQNGAHRKGEKTYNKKNADNCNIKYCDLF